MYIQEYHISLKLNMILFIDVIFLLYLYLIYEINKKIM